MTTYTDFYRNLANLEVVGVRRVYQTPPVSLNTADMPCSWVQIPEGQEAPITFITHGGWPALRADFVIVTEPVGQNILAFSYPQSLDIMDNLADRLRATVAGTISKGKIEWSIRKDIAQVGEVFYHAIIAEVTTHG